MYRIIRIVVACLLLYWGSIQEGYAKEIKGIEFLPVLEAEGVSMELKGVGLKKVFFMKAFVAGLYLEDNVEINDALTNVFKRIEASYFVHIPAKKLSKYTENLMQKNMTKQEYGLLDEHIQTMRSYFVDLKPGDKYALTYVPHLGTQFEHNGKVIGMIKGEIFAKGLFSTWIGQKPMDKKVKKQILGMASMPKDDAFKVLF